MTAWPRPTLRGWCVAGAGAALVLIGALTGFVDLVRAGIFALGLVVLALLLVALASAAHGENGVRRRGPEETMRAGTSSRIFVETTGRGGITLAETHLVEPHTFSDDVVRLAPSTLASYEVLPRHRGPYTSGPSYLETRDPLALAAQRRDVATATQWVVWPRVNPIDEVVTTTPGQGEETAVSTLAAHHGEPGASTRPYVRGDDTRLVHWPATAHRGELIIRQFDPPADDVVRLILVGAGHPFGVDTAWERLIEQCASTWVHLHGEQRRAELVVDDVTFTRLEEGLDALALVEESPAPMQEPDVATWAFVHASAQRLPQAPRHASARAVVTGDTQATTTLARRLEDAGWQIHVLETTDGAQETRSERATAVTPPGRADRRSPRGAHLDVEGAA